MAKKNQQKTPIVTTNTTTNGEVKTVFTNPLKIIEKNWWVFLLLASLILIVYANAFNAGLVSDDKGLQTEGANLVKFSYIFSDPLSTVRSIINAFIYTIGGVNSDGTVNSWMFRSLNIFFHLGNTFLVFIIVAMLMRKEIAFFASVLFAIHPILIEAVTWISGGPYSQYTFFFLVSFLFYLLSGKNFKFYWISLGAYLIGLLSSNRIMTLSLIFLVYELSLGDIKRNWKKLIPFFFLSLIWGLYYVAAIGPRAAEVQKASNADSLTYNPFFQLPFSITNYLQLLVWPDGLSFYHSNIDVPGFEIALRWLALLIFFGVGVWGFVKKKLVFFWIAFFIIGLLINLTPFSIAWLVAERYAYLSTIGIFVLVGYLFYRLSKINKNFYYVAYILFAVIVLALSVRTIVRNMDWKDEDTLMLSTLRTNPENAKVHNHIGIIYGKKKDYVNAMREFQLAMKLDPNLAETYHNMGNAFDEQARAMLDPQKQATASAQVKKTAEDYFNQAVVLYEKALSLDPNHWLSYQQLANIYFDRGEYQKTADYILKILPLNPNPALFTNLGVVYLKLGDKEKAKQAFQEALSRNPANTFAQQALQDIDNPALLAPQSSAPQEENPAMPNGQLPPEVLKAIQEQTKNQPPPSQPPTP